MMLGRNCVSFPQDLREATPSRTLAFASPPLRGFGSVFLMTLCVVSLTACAAVDEGEEPSTGVEAASSGPEGGDGETPAEAADPAGGTDKDARMEQLVLETTREFRAWLGQLMSSGRRDPREFRLLIEPRAGGALEPSSRWVRELPMMVEWRVRSDLPSISVVSIEATEAALSATNFRNCGDAMGAPNNRDVFLQALDPDGPITAVMQARLRATISSRGSVRSERLEMSLQVWDPETGSQVSFKAISTSEF